MTVLLQLILSLTPKIYLRDTDCIKYEHNVNVPLRFLCCYVSFVFATREIQFFILLQIIKIVISHKLKKFLFKKYLNLLLYFYMKITILILLFRSLVVKNTKNIS